ncbi:hypothetical protein SLE2022_254160 [Rubroshorea leprosula]
MENQILLLFSLFSLIFFNSANSVCVPRNLSDLDVFDNTPSTSSSPKSNPLPSQPSQNSFPSSPQPSPAAADPSHTSEQSGFIAGAVKDSINGILGAVGSAVGGMAAGASPRPEVQKICEKTDYPLLCTSALNPVFNGNTDPLNVIELLIKSASQQTKSAQGTVSQKASTPGLDQKTAAAYADCKDIYDEALDNLQEALDAIASKDIPTIQTMLSAAISDFSSCDDGFTGQPDPNAKGVSPMAATGENLMNMVDNILAIANAIP